MEGQLDDLVDFLMQEEEADVQTNNAAEILAGDQGIANDHMMPTGTDDHDQLEAADWYSQYFDLHLPADNKPSNEVYRDDLLLDVADYYVQENDSFLIDQYIHENEHEALPLQQQAGYCHNGQPSTSLPAVLPPPTDGDNNEVLLNSTSGQQQVQDREEPDQERLSELLKEAGGGPAVKRAKRRRKKGKQVLVVPHVEEEDEALASAEADAFVKDLLANDDDDEDDTGDDNQSSKNLVSERNRRKRLNEQLFKLRSLVPNITKMDKRSVLVDALAHLRDILQQTQIEENRINGISTTANVATEDPGHAIVAPTAPEPPVAPNSALLPAITETEAEKVAKERYLLKIVCNKAPRALTLVQRLIEMLKGFDSINVSVTEYGDHHMQFSTFLRVKKQKGSKVVTDDEKLLEMVKTKATQLGLRLPPAVSSADN